MQSHQHPPHDVREVAKFSEDRHQELGYLLNGIVPSTGASYGIGFLSMKILDAWQS